MKKINLDLIKRYIIKKDNMIILILTGILFLVIAWPVGGNDKKETNVTDLWDRKSDSINLSNRQKEMLYEEMAETEQAGDDSQILQEENMVKELEEKLENLLSSVQGVGQVKVMLTLADKGEKIVEKDIPLERSNVVENDSAGGNRSTNEMFSQEETVYITNSEGEKIPYVIRETSARVLGVSVVAQGGDREEVQKNISEMIQALFGIEEHKIKVVKMKQQE